MLRLNDKEYDLVKHQAERAGYPTATYVRKQIIGTPLSIRYEIVADINEIKILTAEFGRIGNNLNQIAKYFNSGGTRSLAMEDEIHECIIQLFELNNEVLRMAR